MREAELADLKKQVDGMTSEVRSYGTFDPVSEVRREPEKTQSQIENVMVEKPAIEQAALAAAENVAPVGTNASDAAPSACTPTDASQASAVDATAPMPSDESGSASHAAEGKAT